MRKRPESADRALALFSPRHFGKTMRRVAMPRISTRPSQVLLLRIRKVPSFGHAALLFFLLLATAPLPAQMAAGFDIGPIPTMKPPTVDGFVTAVDGNVVTLLGSQLLTLDLTGAVIVQADADAADVTPPPIAPGAHIAAIVDASGPVIAVYPPPPLKVIRAVVLPAGTALLTGEIQDVGPNNFSLLFRTILVDAGTVFSGEGDSGPVKGLSDLKPGMQAEVRVTANGDPLTAAQVVAFSPTAVPKPIFFRGVVKAIRTDSWTIGDMTVGVTTDTKIVGDPKVGDTADVVAIVVNPPNPRMGMPSRIVAVSIVKLLVLRSPVVGRGTSFTGEVQAMPPTVTLGLWRIAGRTVTVTGLTTIEGNPTVGSTVTVAGYALPNPLAGAAAVTASAVASIATDIKTIS
jgi:hypothetical protein